MSRIATVRWYDSADVMYDVNSYVTTCPSPIDYLIGYWRNACEIEAFEYISEQAIQVTFEGVN